jgi:ABC-type lipoprotein export system ATPase subunit
LYCAAGGIAPHRVLPIALDVGTNNKALLEDPNYVGIQKPRLTGAEYFDFVDEFMAAVQSRWPNAVIQFEDFESSKALPLLAKYRNKKIGMVFQQFNVLKSFNVITNIAMPQTLNGTGRRRRLERARHLLSIFGLDKIAKRLPTEISGGQQQRVAIARALVNNPWILIADEPTGNLDSKAASEVMELLAKLNENSHRTLILVTHNPEYLYAPHRIFYMKDGKIDREVVNRSINKEVTEADINNDQLLKEAASESIKQSEERKGMA